jgi:hypothetical protein
MKRSNTPRTKPSKGSLGVADITRYVDPKEERLLWTRSAGRCEFSGCNKPLWKSAVTQERVNIAQKAHIWAFSSDGPRGNKGIAKTKLNKAENLLLVCHGCHRKIDQHKDGGPYTVDLLRQWKTEHELRIEIVTGIDPSKRSHILLYGENVGEHSSPLNFSEAAQALFPCFYPADDRGILLSAVDGSTKDSDPRFWQRQAEHLVTRFKQRISERVSGGEIGHLSVFGIAPQPLLILLGSLMIDFTKAEVYQRHREPQTWAWPEKASKLRFTVQEPGAASGSPALIIALTAEVTDERVTDAIGADAAIWRLTVPRPNNELIKSRKHLSDFRTTVRELIDRIKARHGQTTPLHVFPVAGVAAAVELGRVRMPKAHMPWILYDQVNARGGFVRAISLPFGD